MTNALSPSIQQWLASAPPSGLHSHRIDLLGSVDSETARQQAFFHLQAKSMLTRVRGVIDGPMVVLKGIEVAQLYPEPWQRDFVDVDIVVDELLQADRRLRAAGFKPLHNAISHPDYHQTAALILGDDPVTIELHRRPNSPRWNHFPVEEVFAEALPSRTGVDGVLRPRDDHHAVIVAWHYWRDGANRGRGLIDVQLLREQSSNEAISLVAEQWGVGRIWEQTQKVLDAIERPGDAGLSSRWLLDLSEVSHRTRRARQWWAIAMGGRGGASEVWERLVRQRERKAE